MRRRSGSNFWRAFLLLLLVSGLHSCTSSSALAARPTGPGDKLKPKDPYALIFGTVWSPDGRPVYGVTVKLRRLQDKHARWEVVSNHRGEFAQRVPAGKMEYVVWADLKGFKLADGAKYGPGQEVHVPIENDERTDIGLHLTEAVK